MSDEERREVLYWRSGLYRPVVESLAEWARRFGGESVPWVALLAACDRFHKPVRFEHEGQYHFVRRAEPELLDNPVRQYVTDGAIFFEDVYPDFQDEEEVSNSRAIAHYKPPGLPAKATRTWTLMLHFTHQTSAVVSVEAPTNRDALEVLKRDYAEHYEGIGEQVCDDLHSFTCDFADIQEIEEVMPV